MKVRMKAGSTNLHNQIKKDGAAKTGPVEMASKRKLYLVGAGLIAGMIGIAVGWLFFPWYAENFRMTWNMSWNTILGLGLNIAGSIILVMAAGGPISALVNLVRLLLKSRRKVTCGSPAELNNQSSQQEIPRPPGDVPGLRGRLILPDRSEILLRGELNRIGRDDFLNILPPKDLKLVSREHFVIVGGDIGDTLEDQSMNGTMINGRDISKQGWQELKDGDRICVAGILDLVYLAR